MKAAEYRDAQLFAVIASCTTGKAFDASYFINDPEAAAKKVAAQAAYERATQASRAAYKSQVNGPN